MSHLPKRTELLSTETQELDVFAEIRTLAKARGTRKQLNGQGQGSYNYGYEADLGLVELPGETIHLGVTYSEGPPRGGIDAIEVFRIETNGNHTRLYGEAHGGHPLFGSRDSRDQRNTNRRSVYENQVPAPAREAIDRMYACVAASLAASSTQTHGTR